MPKNKRVKRSGRLDKEERQYIQDNYQDMTVEELSKEMNRRPEAIKGFIVKLAQVTSHNNPGSFDIRSRPFFYLLKQQFDEFELRFFESEWNKLIHQFKEDVQATEEGQIRALISTQILVNRHLIARRGTDAQIIRLEELIFSLSKTPDMERNEAFDKKRMDLEIELASLRTISSSQTKEYTTLRTDETQKVRDLRATRAQRIANATEGNMNWVQLIKKLEDKKFRDQEVREAALLNMAANKERERLSQYHEFADGEVDQPLLTPDNVITEN